MITTQLKNVPAAIPLRFQLDRLRVLGTQLKGSLGRYRQEPRTRDQFVRREMLRSRLQTLEKRCNEFRVRAENDAALKDRSLEELDLLRREFRNLEMQVKGFTQR
ncbi:hypothetical protein [Robiginitalea aurantiaca]|uniref:Uncharacterized protein n=1 Tax=Robiginitalea aurantiaca TaxID=3056915 RepID=A0ABT7WFJ8_9FLAO|nr:hypothetical protein [Robiginitalea aurantiaca]MDM9631694.1 hypothetical protein [Robiginitalea aurantiaca]